MARLRSEAAISYRCLEFGILTAARSAEMLGARWDEIDIEARAWTIPANRMKAARAHRVPLSARAVAILCELKVVQSSEYVFAGQRSVTFRVIPPATASGICCQQSIGSDDVALFDVRDDQMITDVVERIYVKTRRRTIQPRALLVCEDLPTQSLRVDHVRFRSGKANRKPCRCSGLC